MMERLIARMLAPLERALANMVLRGMVSGVDDSGKVQTLQISGRSGSAKSFIEHMQAYGLSVHPKRGAEHVSLFFAGDTSHGVTLVVADRRYRLQGLAEGEVALHDDQGQKVHITRSGIVIDGGGKPINIQNTPHVTATTDKFTISGDLEVGGKADVTGNIATLANVTAVGNVTATGNVAAANVAAVSSVTAMGGALSMDDIKSKYNSHTHADPQGGSVGTPSVLL